MSVFWPVCSYSTHMLHVTDNKRIALPISDCPPESSDYPISLKRFSRRREQYNH